MNSNLFKIALMILMIALVLIAFMPQLRNLVKSPEEFQEKYQPSQEEIASSQVSMDLGFSIDDSASLKDRIKTIMNNLDKLAYQKIDHGIVYTPIYIRVDNPDCSNLKHEIMEGLGWSAVNPYSDTSLDFGNGCWDTDFNHYDYNDVVHTARQRKGTWNCDSSGVEILLRIGKYIDGSSSTYLYTFCVRPE